MLNTETPSSLHTALDTYPTATLTAVLIDDQYHAVQAVRAVAARIAQAVDAALPRIQAGGRLIYAGAGTSGRLGVLDSVELLPTFSWPNERAIGLLAGGQQAMFIAVEGAEDNTEQGAADIAHLHPQADDVVLLIAASGTTPYVLGALHAARAAGALTIGLANNPATPLLLTADIGIGLDTGNELISGSTRLKAGTAQKIALNTFSTALMVKLHKVYGNLMVDVKPTNVKLLRRTVSLAMHATGHDEKTCRRILEECDFHVKTAIVALQRHISVSAAGQLLEQHQGDVRSALESAIPDAPHMQRRADEKLSP
ncbi:N-acetylmuramic acid 6-phosphate etherase [Undibacterium griseum]|uniref:N-acetylmuramic acid 6-phosphate etherase n=1 Tax=Undibacterium griseum TaxID=2762295 RepID=A0ABR6YMW6_9BURK|nr:N-acetylmuramic acid 6-phosphate etherase [Undibacterium griseum]MBC3885237.1 N-acetylmuramic acid 6-phosphate etherase [Undibacterium griseum]